MGVCVCFNVKRGSEAYVLEAVFFKQEEVYIWSPRFDHAAQPARIPILIAYFLRQINLVHNVHIGAPGIGLAMIAQGLCDDF